MRGRETVHVSICSSSQPIINRICAAPPKDLNGDGELDYTEFLAVTLQERRLEDEDNVVFAFKVGRGLGPGWRAGGMFASRVGGARLRGGLECLLVIDNRPPGLNRPNRPTQPTQLTPQHYDADGDGFITKAELLAALEAAGIHGLNKEAVDRIMATADEDGDGRINYSEVRGDGERKGAAAGACAGGGRRRRPAALWVVACCRAAGV